MCSANYVAREGRYAVRPFAWSELERLTTEEFHGPAYEAKLDEILTILGSLGVTSIELWEAHLHPAHASNEHLAIARRLLDRHGMEVVSYTSGFRGEGVREADVERVFELAKGLGARVVSHMFDDRYRPWVAKAARGSGVRFAIENHPERDPQEIIERIGSESDVIGTVVDTGHWAGQGVDPVTAIYALRDHLLHVHLKDVVAVGTKEWAPIGDGIADCRRCVQALYEIGYEGFVSIEYEPKFHDPTDELRTSVSRVRTWLAELEGSPLNPRA